MANQAKVKAVKEQYEKKWLAMREVASIGIGKVDNDMGIIVSVTENAEAVRQNIPTRIEGIAIKVQETGAFRAQ